MPFYQVSYQVSGTVIHLKKLFVQQIFTEFILCSRYIFTKDISVNRTEWVSTCMNRQGNWRSSWGPLGLQNGNVVGMLVCAFKWLSVKREGDEKGKSKRASDEVRKWRVLGALCFTEAFGEAGRSRENCERQRKNAPGGGDSEGKDLEPCIVSSTEEVHPDSSGVREDTSRHAVQTC